MAVSELEYTPSSLAFGDVAVGHTKTLTVTVTNNTDPTAAIAVTCAFVTGTGLALGSGDDSFSLAANDDARVIDVTWTPAAVGALSDTLNITHDAGSPASPIAIALTGTAYSNIYALPEITRPAGTMKIDLIGDLTLEEEWTIPTTVSITSMGPLVELIDVDPGVVDVQNLELELSEDYSTYAEGFWYHVIQSDPTKDVQFRFILEEDGTDTFYFWGRVYRENVEWPERYVATDESSVIRTVRLQLVSLVHSLKDADIDDTVAEIIANQDGPIADTYTMHGILASIVSASFSQSFALGNAIIRSCDIRFYEQDGTTVVATADAICVDGSIGGYRVYIDTSISSEADDQDTNPLAWKFQFSNPYDLLKALCLTFGWISRHFYGQSDGSYAGDSTDKHRLEFITRGTAYATLITPEKGVKESTLHSDTVIKKLNIRVSDIHSANDSISPVPPTVKYDQTTGQSWSIDGAQYLCPTPGVSGIDEDYPVKEPPIHSEFDFDVGVQFTLNTWYLSGGNETATSFYYRGVHYDNGAGGAVICLHVAYWDYVTGAWVQTQSYPAALLAYYANRFTADRKMFERSYGSLKFTESSTTSHRILQPMKRIEIDDQIATATYYAAEIRKDFTANESTVLWIAE